MKMLLRPVWWLVIVTALAWPSTAAPLGSSFIYQGRLMDGSQPANGLYDFLFRLYDAPSGGNAVGPLLATNALPVNNGLFMVELDFGAGAFTGEARWLQISVQTNGSARLTALSPRQAVTPAPQAQLALTVPDGAITGAKLAPGAVQATHLQAGAITAGHLAAGAVQASNIVSGAITSTQLAAGAVQSNHLASAAIGANHLAAGAASANLAAGGQAGVGPGGIILSANADNAELVAAGYLKIGQATLGTNSWQLRVSPGELLWPKAEHTATWTGTEMIVFGSSADRGPNWAPVVSYNPALDSWRSLPQPTNFWFFQDSSMQTPLRGHRAVWTGAELIVWGDVHHGYAIQSDRPGRGVIFNPTTQTWRSMTTNGAPSQRVCHTAVWTGSEMIVWGGWYYDAGLQRRHRSDGGRYDPATDTWSPLNQTNRPTGRAYHAAVWTGSEMIVWGGDEYSLGMKPGTGGRYHPATDTWRAVSTNNAPEVRTMPTAIWTGAEMVIWGGADACGGDLQDGRRYRPDSDAWLPLSTNTGGMQPRSWHTAVWTGSRMVVWGGESGTESQYELYAEDYPDQGGVYDPGSDSWSLLPLTGAPVPRSRHSAVWTGSKMIVWGGLQTSWTNFYYPDVGGCYDPASNMWQPTAPTGEHRRRAHHRSVWTGNELIVWGGWDGEMHLDTGERFNPSSSTWQPLPTTNAPSARRGHTAVWTGSEMLVWGGYDGTRLHTGGRYHAAADAWTPIPTNGAPVARRDHSAVWTGSEMIVWGGRAASLQNTGGRYQPLTDTWSTVATAGAPEARYGHTAVWTGDEMIVWGGRSLIGCFFTGARYRPANNTWTALPNAPTLSGRDGHAAVWTGSEMIVWGGFNGATNLQTGARYNPAANTWTEMSVQNAPAPRSGHTLVWDGTHVIVWGGENGGDTLRTGGRYDPLTDTWSTLPTVDAPQCSHHPAAWVGTVMLIHGGFDGFQYSSALHAYSPARQVFLYLKP